MPNFRHYFMNGFSGCRLLAETRDVYRGRDVRVFMIPGDDDNVGVSDGTDCWVAPVIADPFRVDVRKLIARIRAGEEVAVVRQAKRERRQLVADDVPAAEAQQSEQPRRTRRVLLA